MNINLQGENIPQNLKKQRITYYSNIQSVASQSPKQPPPEPPPNPPPKPPGEPPVPPPEPPPK